MVSQAGERGPDVSRPVRTRRMEGTAYLCGDEQGIGLAGLIRDRRRAASLTQRELAELAAVSVGALRDLEQGRTRRPHAGMLVRIGRALGVEAVQINSLCHTETIRPVLTVNSEHGSGIGSGLWLQVLGGLTAWRGGVRVKVGEPKQRAVLGLLALKPNAVVRLDALTDLLWGEDPPASATGLVQTYVSRLRRLLDPGRSARDRSGLLISTGGGYRLQISAGQLDLLAFHKHVEGARAAQAAGRWCDACDAYEHALMLWRDRPLADVPALRAHPAVVDLDHIRRRVVSTYTEVAGQADRYEHVLPHLHRLAADDPWDENAHAQLMMVQANTGHQVAALRVFDDMRRRLDDQLGIRPGPQLRAAYTRIVDHAGPDAPPPADAVPRRAARRQLPAGIRCLVGRAQQIQRLTGLLSKPSNAGAATIVAIDGMAGVGKTALAIQWAHQVAHRFPDGQLYANLRGFEPDTQPAAPAEVIHRFLDALAVPADKRPADPGSQADLYRSLLAGTRTLVVLDNARDADQVRPLLPADSGCAVVITSRARMTGLAATHGAYLLPLDVLTVAEARELLQHQLGGDRLSRESAAADRLIQLCGRLPLAMSVLAARAATQPGLSLERLAAQCEDASDGLDAFSTGETASSVRAVLSCSYRCLSPPAARAFRLLGLHPGLDISLTAAASLTGASLSNARRTFDELAHMNLVTIGESGRFGLHDLLRAFARDLAHALDDDVERCAASRRLFDHYLYTAHAADRLLNPTRAAIHLSGPQQGTTPGDITDHHQALAWFDVEYQALDAIAAHATAAGLHSYAWQLPWLLGTFLDCRGRWRQRVALLHRALSTTQHLGDRLATARIHRDLGAGYARISDYRQAHSHFHQALGLYRKLDDLAGQAWAYDGLAWLSALQHRYRTALDRTGTALRLYQDANHRPGQADCYNATGWYQAQLGDLPAALQHCQHALAIYRQDGDLIGEADTLDSLGYIRHRLGQHDQAIRCYHCAVALWSDLKVVP